jgi:hypothetical protein
MRRAVKVSHDLQALLPQRYVGLSRKKIDGNASYEQDAIPPQTRMNIAGESMVPSAGYPMRLDATAPLAKKPFFFWLILTVGIAFIIMYGYTGWMVIHYATATAPSGWWQELSVSPGCQPKTLH